MAGEAHERTLSVFAGHFDIGGALLEGASLGRGRESARRYQGCLTKAGSLRFACAMNFLEGESIPLLSNGRQSALRWVCALASMPLQLSFASFGRGRNSLWKLRIRIRRDCEGQNDATAQARESIARERGGTVIHNTIEPAHGHFSVFSRELSAGRSTPSPEAGVLSPFPRCYLRACLPFRRMRRIRLPYGWARRRAAGLTGKS